MDAYIFFELIQSMFYLINISQNGKDDKDIGEVVLLAKNESGYKNLLLLRFYNILHLQEKYNLRI